jgi:dihydroorotate dehydrogenase electron transfer subunit
MKLGRQSEHVPGVYMSGQSIEFKIPVCEAIKINDKAAILVLEAPEIAQQAEPGQFINIACDQFLRRPIGLMSVDRKKGMIRVGIRVQGPGTRWLALRKPGDILSVLGPLGHGFTLEGYQRVITIGGGTGVFPLLFVHQVCRERNLESLAVCGYRSRDDSLLLDTYRDLGCRTLFASDAGDLDIAGQATDALAVVLEELVDWDQTVLLTCGPRPMMRSVAELARKYNLACQVSMEERMACGVGVCLGCACETHDPSRPGNKIYQRCCVDGPVFDSAVIVW